MSFHRHFFFFSFHKNNNIRRIQALNLSLRFFQLRACIMSRKKNRIQRVIGRIAKQMLFVPPLMLVSGRTRRLGLRTGIRQFALRGQLRALHRLQLRAHLHQLLVRLLRHLGVRVLVKKWKLGMLSTKRQA